jgi:hypothetical protein
LPLEENLRLSAALLDACSGSRDAQYALTRAVADHVLVNHSGVLRRRLRAVRDPPAAR